MQTTAIKKLLWLAFYSLPLLAFAAHGTGPSDRGASPQTARALDLPLKVTILKSHRAQLASLALVPAKPPGVQTGRATAQEVKAYVQTEATEFGVNPKLALWIFKHESEFTPRAKGDREASRGLWQISKIYHPEVSDAMAF